MSDVQQGPGWWRASDGRWYPPETHPAYRPPAPPPQPPGPPRPPGSPPRHAEPLAPLPTRPPKAQDEPGGVRGAWRKFRGLPRWVQIAAWVGVVILVAGIAGAGSDKKNEEVATVSTSARATASTPASTTATLPATTRATTPTTAVGPKTTFGDGTYRVGVDIAPGTYVAPGGSGCYWERQRVFGGGLDSIIANDLSRGGQVVVTIEETDKGFKTARCGTWRQS